MSNTAPLPEQRFYMIRGDTWTQTLGVDITEVVEAPADYVFEWILRPVRSDAATSVLTMTGVLSENDEYDPDVAATCPTYTVPPLLAQFTATPAETQGLAPMDHDYYVQWRTQDATAFVKRLFQGTMRLGD